MKVLGLHALLIVLVTGISAQKSSIFDTLMGIYDSVTTEEITGYFRVEAKILRLVNTEGLVSTGSYCDTIGPCDPIVSAFVDYEAPNADFGAPASVDYKFYTKLFEVREQNSPLIDKIITRDICGQTFKKINVRVNVMDRDRIGSNDLLNNFKCFVNVKKKPAANMELADWSPEAECEGLSQRNKIKLFWKHRMFRVDQPQTRSLCCLHPNGVLVPPRSENLVENNEQQQVP